MHSSGKGKLVSVLLPNLPSEFGACSRLVRPCRWDEVRHQAVSLLAAFLAEEGGVPPTVDLQNFVAFQDGFDKLFKAVGEASGGCSDVRCRGFVFVTYQCAAPEARWPLINHGLG